MTSYDAKTLCHARANQARDLLALIAQGITEYEQDGGWGEAGSLGHATQLLVEAAFAVGKITVDEAKKYNVTL